MRRIAQFLLCITGSIFALSGPITTNTTWSSDVILTGNTTVNAGVTLTIAAGVKVESVWLDNNADGIGDITFTVNGILASQGTSGNPVLFQSYDRKNSRQSWMGMVFSGPKQTATGLKIKHAYKGLSIVAAADSNSITATAIDSCIDGVYLDGVNDSTRLVTMAVRYCRYGLRAVNGATRFYGEDVDINHNDAGGIMMDGATGRFYNTVVYSNGMFGIKALSSGILTLSNSTVTANQGYGIFVDMGTVANVTLCSIINNDKPGILVTSNTPNSLNLSASNIYGNSLAGFKVDTVDIVRLGISDNARTSGYCLPIYTKGITSQFSFGARGIAMASYARGGWNSGERGDGPYLDTFVTPSVEGVALSGGVECSRGCYSNSVSLISYLFNHAHQLLYITASSNVVSAQDNWWGQFTSVDTLIGTQVLVNYSNFRTSPVTEAGSTNSTQRITTSKLSMNFPGTAVTFADSTTFTITNTGGSILSLNSLTIPDPNFTFRHKTSTLSGGSIDTVTIKFAPTTATTFSTYLTIQCNDPTQGTVQILLTGTGLAYNFRPRFMVKPTDTMVIAGNTFSRTVTAQDSNLTDALAYSILRGPSGLTIASTTGIISWSPALAAVTDSVVMRVQDPLGLADTTRFKLTVAHKPIFTTATPVDTIVEVGAVWDFDVNASDADGHSIAWTLDDYAGNMMISPASGLVHFVPSITDTGRKLVTVRATDPLGAYATQSFYLRVRSGGPVLAPNMELPMLSHNFGQVRITTRAYLPLVLRNTGLATLVVDSIKSNVSKVTVNWTTRQVAVASVETLLVYFDPDSIKTYSGFLTLYSNDPQKRQMQFQVSGQGTQFNVAPYFTRLQADTLINAGMALVLPGLGADSTPTDTITYSLIGAPTGMTINAFTGAIAWQTVSNTPSVGIKVKVTDKYTATVTDSVYIKVNHAPVINTVFKADTSLYTGIAYTFPVTATEPDGNRIVFSLDSAIAGMVIDAVTGTIILAPTTVGKKTVYVKAADTLGMSSRVPFTITVKAGNSAVINRRMLPKTFSANITGSASGLAMNLAIPVSHANNQIVIRLFDMRGRILGDFSRQFAPGMHTVNLGNRMHANGQYLLKVETTGFSRIMRLANPR